LFDGRYYFDTLLSKSSTSQSQLTALQQIKDTAIQILNLVVLNRRLKNLSQQNILNRGRNKFRGALLLMLPLGDGLVF